MRGRKLGSKESTFYPSIVTHAERIEGRTNNCITVDNGCAAFRGDRFEVRLTVLMSLLINKSAEASEAVSQLGLQSLERICQLFATTVVDVCTSLRFA